jgi:hypothetical protein
MKEMIATACQENVEHPEDHFEQKLQNLADTFAGSIAGNGRPPTQQPQARINSPQKEKTILI